MGVLVNGVQYINNNNGFFLVVFTAIYAFFSYLLFLKNRDIHLSNIAPLPLITFNTGNQVFEIENVGNGIAISIIFEEYNIFLMDANAHYRIIFKNINMLKPGIKHLLEEKEAGPTFFVAYPSKPIQIKFFFSDIIGTKYFGIIQLGKESVFVSRIIRLNIARYVYVWFGFLWEKIQCLYYSQKMRLRQKRK